MDCERCRREHPDDCELCQRKADPNDELYCWNGPGRSHCNHCHADWKQTSNATHCNRCHLTFRSPEACELHEWPDACLVPEVIGLVGEKNRWGTVIYRRASGETTPE